MKKFGIIFFVILLFNITWGEWGEPQLVPGINSGMTDYFPCITQDGTKMYFTSYRTNNEDIYVSERINGIWTAPVNLGPPINSVHRDFAPAISPDGRTLYFTSYNREGGYGSYDIWYSEWQDSSQSWGELINPGPNINSPSTEWAPSFSHDGSKMYFSSGYPFRPGHVGGLDLYVSEWDGEGWDPAVNLGEEVNTYGIDYCPSIASDDTTLYFASHHHHYLPCWHGPAIDIFVAYYTNGEWTNVENICDFASRRGGGSDDIYFSVKQPTGIESEIITPVNFSIISYPNPFNEQTQIRLQLSSLDPVEIGLYDLLGRKVQSIFEGVPRDNNLEFEIDLSSDQYSSGIYFIVAEQGRERRVVKSTLLK
jgi:Tol biopolymer transport system component